MKLNKNKIILATLFSICLLILVTFLFYPISKKTTKDKMNPFLSLEGYHQQNLKRYQNYQKKYPDIQTQDIVTQVNMNLDYGFYNQIITQNNPNELETIVNKIYKLEETYEPTDLVTINTYKDQHDYAYPYRQHTARQVVYDDFTALKNSCLQKGFELYVTSGYRSTSWQNEIYRHMVETYDQTRADETCSRPGHSEHTTGLAMDIALDQYQFEDVINHPQYQWFLQQLPKYGFIIRYPEGKENLTGYHYEPWHIRYLGKNLAQKVTKSGLTYDEYYARKH